MLFIALGQFMSKKLMDRAGGPNSMMFNGGNSNARVYVQSSDGIKFDDVEGVDEAEESLQGDRGLSPQSGQVPGDRRFHAQGRSAGGPPGTGKDHAGKGRRR